MSDTVVCQSEAHGLPSEGDILTFSYYHEKCFTFPNRYIEALARRDMVFYTEWPNGVWPNTAWNRSEKTIHIVPLSRISQSTQWGRVCCEECWLPLHPDKVEKETTAQQSLFDLEGVS